MPSFDIVSKIDPQELDNALNQARKELKQRYDFKGTDASVELSDTTIVLKANSEGRVDAVWDVVTTKLVKRKVPIEAFTRGKQEPAGGKMVRQVITVQQGIPAEAAKKIVKLIKDKKMKVQISIQGDTVRISGKKRDHLQDAIAAVKEVDLGVATQYVNFRD